MTDVMLLGRTLFFNNYEGFEFFHVEKKHENVIVMELC